MESRLWLCCIFAPQIKIRDMIVNALKRTLFAVLVVVLSSCGGCYKIDGVVEAFGYEGRELSLIEFQPFRTTKFDSCMVNHGRFQMKGHTDSTRLVFLCKGDQPVIPLYLEKGHCKVTMLSTEMTVSGTRQNDLFYSFLKQKGVYDNLYEETFQKNITMSRAGFFDSSVTNSVQDSLRKIVSECEDMIISFMADNYREPAAVGVFMMLSGPPSHSISPLLKRILDNAPESFLKEPFVDGYIKRVAYQR